MASSVLDASVAVAAIRRSEPGHVAALRHCQGLFAGNDETVVPAIFDVEVISALVRRGANLESVSLFFDRHLSNRRVVTLGPGAALAVRSVVGLTRLRAADAFYVWVAMREGLPLVTADQEVVARAHLAGVQTFVP